MMNSNLVNAFPSRFRRFTLDSDLFKNDLRVFQGDSVIVYDKDVQILG